MQKDRAKAAFLADYVNDVRHGLLVVGERDSEDD